MINALYNCQVFDINILWSDSWNIYWQSIDPSRGGYFSQHDVWSDRHFPFTLLINFVRHLQRLAILMVHSLTLVFCQNCPLCATHCNTPVLICSLQPTTPMKVSVWLIDVWWWPLTSAGRPLYCIGPVWWVGIHNTLVCSIVRNQAEWLSGWWVSKKFCTHIYTALIYSMLSKIMFTF